MNHIHAYVWDNNNLFSNSFTLGMSAAFNQYLAEFRLQIFDRSVFDGRALWAI